MCHGGWDMLMMPWWCVGNWASLRKVRDRHVMLQDYWHLDLDIDETY